MKTREEALSYLSGRAVSRHELAAGQIQAEGIIKHTDNRLLLSCVYGNIGRKGAKIYDKIRDLIFPIDRLNVSEPLIFVAAP